MDRLGSRILLAAALCSCGVAPTATNSSSRATTITPATSPAPVSPSATAALTAPAAKRTPRVGGCTSPQFSSKQFLERYFLLTTSGDVAAALDCFAKVYRDKGDLEASASMWVTAGPLSSLKIDYVDAVNGCDRYSARYQFARPDLYFPDGFQIFYTVGPEAGVMRIFDGGTGLARPDLITTVCR